LYVSGLVLSNADPARSIAILRQSVDLNERLGNESERAGALAFIAALEARHGDARLALEALRDEIVTPVPLSRFRADLYMGVQVFNRVGRPDLVARCYGVTQSRYPFLPPLYRKFTDYAVEEARASLGHDTFDALATEGASIGPEQFGEALQREIDELLTGM
jgi:hypothetical protein